jgi:hypothetical protein
MYPVFDLILRIVGYIPTDLKIREQGRAARGTITCHCGKQASMRACSDVSGVWINCPDCGFSDI